MYAKFSFPEVRHGEKRLTLADGAKECLKSPKTRGYLIFWGVWGFSVNLASAFFNKYAIDVQRLSFMQVVIFGQIVANAVAVFIIPRWGRFIDRYGCAPLLFLTCAATGIATLAWLPATPGSIAPILCFNLLGGVVWCGTDVSALNMQMSHTPDIGRPLVLAIYAIVSSFSAAAAFIAGGAFLELMGPIMDRAGLAIFGASFDNYKLLFAITALLRLLTVAVFLPRVWNEKGMTARQAYADMHARSRIWLRGTTIYARRRARHWLKAARKRLKAVCGRKTARGK
jgi:MFS family permease